MADRERIVISDEYRALNARLHEEAPNYGVSGHLWLGRVAEIMDTYGCQTALDYGCGKGTLSRYMERMGLKCANYDPAVSQFSIWPEPADLVVCLDVLEHVEWTRLEDVFEHIHSLSRKLAFFAVATRLSSKQLADGRNAHLIVEPYEWWKPHIKARFRPVKANVRPNFGFDMLAEPK